MHRITHLLVLAGLGFAFTVNGCSCDDGSGGDIPPSVTLNVTSPEDGALLGPEQDVLPDEPGLQVDVVVRTTGLASGAELVLTVNGNRVSGGATVGDDAIATFQAVTLPPGDDVVIEVSAPGGEKASVTVTVLPELLFLEPRDGATVRLQDDLDPDTEGVQVNVVVQAAGLGRDAEVTLSVDGGEVGRVRLDAGENARFEAITLPPGLVTLRAEAVHGDMTLAAEISVTVEEQAHELTFLAPLNGARLTERDDVAPDRDGFQYDVQVRATGFEQGTTVTLEVDGDTVDGALDENLTVTFPGVTLPAGDAVTLAAYATHGGDEIRTEVVVSVPDLTPPPPELSFSSPQDAQVLTADDDVNQNLLDGFQAGITLQVVNVENGQEVHLFVDGVELDDTAPVINGTAEFGAVSLPEAPEGTDGVALRATVANERGDEAQAQITVFVQTGRCVVSLTPLPSDQGCDFTDAEIAEDGTVMGTFVVTTNCEGPIELSVDGEVVATSDPAEGPHHVTFQEVPLHQGDNEVLASATGSGDREGTSMAQVYHVDTVAPEVGITSLSQEGEDEILFSLADDVDPDTDGLQIRLSGWVVGLAPGESLQVTISDSDGQALDGLPEALVSEEQDDQGRYTFTTPGLTIPSTGRYTAQVVAVDGCGNSGSSLEHTFLADVDRATLEIVGPEQGAVLLAADDLDPEADGYQTSVWVRASGVPAGDEVEVRCGPAGDTTRSLVGTATMPEGPVEAVLEVRVTLPDGELGCLAIHRAVNEARSMEVTFRVAGTPPTIVFTEPRSSRVNTETVDVAVMTTNVEDGQEVVLSVNGRELDEHMVVQGGGASMAGVPLDPGPNVLLAVVSDQAGNVARASLDVVRDDVAPEATITSPANGATVTGEQDADEDPSNGLQIDVHVQVSGVSPDEGATACLTVNGLAVPPCPDEPVAVQGDEVVFHGVRFVAGENRLEVVITDGAGNQGIAQAVVTADIDAPTCTILPVDEDNCVGQAQGVEVVVQTDAADGSQAFLTVGDSEIGPSWVEHGQATFTVDLPANARTTLEARIVEQARGVGYSLPVQVTAWTDPGTLTFQAPADGMVLNASVPSVGWPGFQVDVTLSAQGMAAGQAADLTVTCDGGDPSTYEGTVEQAADGLTLVFHSVALVDEGACTMAASTTNCAGMEAAATATVTVDRIPPEISFLFPHHGDSLSFRNDIDAQTPGMQVDVRVSVEGAQDGAQVSLTIGGADPITELLADGSATFRSVTIPNGFDIPLRAEVSDQAGNEARETIVLQEVASDEPTIEFFLPDADETWLAADDDDPDAEGFQHDFELVTQHLRDNLEVRLCSDNPGRGAQGCSREGYGVLATAHILNGRVRFTDTTLSQGDHHVYAEARGTGGEWVESLRTLLVRIDATPPTLLQFAITSDQPPLGVLNAGEDVHEPTEGLQARVAATFVDDPDDPFDGVPDGAGVVLLTDNPEPDTSLSRAQVQGGVVEFPPVTLAEGLHHLSLRVWDELGNPLPDDSPTIQVVVDSVAPTLSFLEPTDGAVINVARDRNPALDGIQLDVTLLASGAEEGQTVALTVGDQAQEPVPAQEGAVTFSGVTLPDGDVGLHGSLTDAAGNEGTADITVTVDSTVPEVVLTVPEPGPDFSARDDLEPNRGGFQIDVQVMVTGVPEGTEVQVLSDSAGGVVSDPARVDAQGLATVRCTLPVGDQELTAVAADEHGNQGTSQPVAVSVEVVGCGVSFLTPAGSPVLLGRAECLNANPDDPAWVEQGCEIQVSFTVANMACNGLDLELLLDGQVWHTVQVQDGHATLNVRFEDGSDHVIQGRMDDGEQTVATEEKRIVTDLTPPSARFTRPGDDPATLLASDDLDGQTQGLQYAFEVELTGMDRGRLRLESDLDGRLLDLPDDIHPDPLTDGQTTLPVVSLGNGEHNLTLTLWDEAGNEARVALVVRADSVPPDTIADLAVHTSGLVDGQDLNLRLPRVQLTWSAPGDDGEQGGPVARYDVRYSSSPIDEGTFDAACPAAVAPAPVQPGEAQAVVLEGPGPLGDCRFRVQGEYYFAVVAIDALGNRSDVAAVGPVSTMLQDTAYSDPGYVGEAGGDPQVSGTFGFMVRAIGDVNGDGYEDVGIATNGEGRVWVLWGGDDPTSLALQEITPRDANGDPPMFFGWQVAGVGDVSGDGVDDFAVADFSGVHLYLGSTDWPDTVPAPTIYLAVDEGMAPAVAKAGNFDGRGLDDLAISDWGLGRSSATWVLSGRSNADWEALGDQITLTLDTGDFDLDGDGTPDLTAFTAPGAISWTTVAGLGNFCGGDDDMDDIVLADRAPGSNGLYVLCGRAITARVGTLDGDGWNVPMPDGVTGFGVAVVGWSSLLDDTEVGLPADTHSEMAVSAKGAKRFYVYPGGATSEAELQGWIQAGLAVEVNDHLEGAGEYIGTLGDFDGNGLDDLIVSTEQNGGMAAVYLNVGEDGGEDGPFPSYDPGLSGEQGSGLGKAVADGVDLTGDGKPEIVVGAPDSGQIFVYHLPSEVGAGN